MADDQDFEIWDDEFLEKAIEATEAAVCSSSNPTQPQRQALPPPPPPHYVSHSSYSPPRAVSSSSSISTQQQRQVLPPPPPPHYASHISYSPPRELSQRVKEDNHRNFPDRGFDYPVSLNGFNRGLNSAPPFPHSSRLHDEDKCSKQEEINRLKEELGRVSKVLTNLEQECLELRKDREKNEKHLRSVLPVNGSKEAEAFCTKKSNLKNKDLCEEDPGSKGAIHCKAVGVQTNEHAMSTELTIEKNSSVTYHSRKLTDIWEPGNDQQPKTNLLSKLFVACGADLQVIFGCLGLNISSKKTTTKMESSKHDLLYMAPNHRIQSVEAAKVSHLYSTLTKISYDPGRLDDLLEELVDLCQVQNTMIVHRCLCVLHVVLKHILSMENRGSSSVLCSGTMSL
ncbi:hypothetical protein L2E82_06806 [Cichorium intybus]|uniref:Uncharacterized protein n=1 Tax=Cichorium intybus TaxID=13427 RepID=A0ACB9HBV8_CICIN|nr:hypothetical protein L2E82_06806 [Cichorium intybus]